MRVAIALFLLLLRLEPLAGAAMCLVQPKASPSHECRTGDSTETEPPAAQTTVAAADAAPEPCPLAIACEPGAPVLLTGAMPDESALRTAHREPLPSTPQLQPGDPLVPPIPPPIA
jgi:hypothetical protein